MPEGLTIVASSLRALADVWELLDGSRTSGFGNLSFVPFLVSLYLLIIHIIAGLVAWKLWKALGTGRPTAPTPIEEALGAGPQPVAGVPEFPAVHFGAANLTTQTVSDFPPRESSSGKRYYSVLVPEAHVCGVCVCCGWLSRAVK